MHWIQSISFETHINLNYFLIYIGASFDLWIIMEYCANGDLQSFLRRSRSVYKENDSEVSLAIDLAVKFGLRDLIHIALQIARGMEFLISRKVRCI